jgi:hypothetical protein
MCWFALGHLADRVVRASIERFASRVMPVLRETPIDEEWLARVRAGEVTGVTRNLDSPAEPVVPTQAIP